MIPKNFIELVKEFDQLLLAKLRQKQLTCPREWNQREYRWVKGGRFVSCIVDFFKSYCELTPNLGHDMNSRINGGLKTVSIKYQDKPFLPGKGFSAIAVKNGLGDPSLSNNFDYLLVVSGQVQRVRPGSKVVEHPMKLGVVRYQTVRDHALVVGDQTKLTLAEKHWDHIAEREFEIDDPDYPRLSEVWKLQESKLFAELDAVVPIRYEREMIC